MRELNRLGLTSVVDAGGSSQSYPGDYEVIRELSRQGLLTVRIAYNLYPQRRGHELEDVTGWIDSLRFDPAEEYFRFNGAGENLQLLHPARQHRGPGLARPEEEPAQPGQRRHRSEHDDDACRVHDNLPAMPSAISAIHTPMGYMEEPRYPIWVYAIGPTTPADVTLGRAVHPPFTDP